MKPTLKVFIPEDVASSLKAVILQILFLKTDILFFLIMVDSREAVRRTLKCMEGRLWKKS